MHAQTTNLQIANMHGGGGKDTHTYWQVWSVQCYVGCPLLSSEFSLKSDKIIMVNFQYHNVNFRVDNQLAKHVQSVGCPRIDFGNTSVLLCT